MSSHIRKIIFFVTVLFALPHLTIAAEKKVNNLEAGIGLDFQVQPLFRGQTTKKHLPVRVTYWNVSAEPLRLLRIFKPIPAFFNVKLTTINHEEIAIPKSAISSDWELRLKQESAWRYLELEPNESFSTVVDIGEFIPYGLEEGTYCIYLTYWNQYGENCVKGSIESERIWVQLIDEPVQHVEGGIAEEEAIEIAKTAVKEKINIRPDEKISVRNTAKRFIVTFESPTSAIAKDAMPLRVHINRITGKVELVFAIFNE